MVSFLEEVRCSNDVTEFKKHLEDSTFDIQPCLTLETYESNQFRSFRRHRLYFDHDRSGGSPFLPLTQYLDSYVDDLMKKHQEWFSKELETLTPFDILDNR